MKIFNLFIFLLINKTWQQGGPRPPPPPPSIPRRPPRSPPRDRDESGLFWWQRPSIYP